MPLSSFQTSQYWGSLYEKYLSYRPIHSYISPTVYAQNERKFILRGGALSIVGSEGNMQLQFNGKTLLRTADDSYGFAIQKSFALGSGDAILVTHVLGGTACPAMYLFVTITHDGKPNLTNEFGSCSDLAVVKRSGSNISVSMPNVYEKGRSTFVYKNGRVR